MYAIIRTGGKQYRVQPGQSIKVEKLTAAEGARVELSDVLMVGDDESTTAGTPLVEGARVVADVVRQGRAKKILVFKYKPKTRYRRKLGHRQPFTELAVRQIVTPGGTYGDLPEQAAEAPAAEEKPKRTRRRKKTEAESES